MGFSIRSAPLLPPVGGGRGLVYCLVAPRRRAGADVDRRARVLEAEVVGLGAVLQNADLVLGVTGVGHTLDVGALVGVVATVGDVKGLVDVAALGLLVEALANRRHYLVVVVVVVVVVAVVVPPVAVVVVAVVTEEEALILEVFLVEETVVGEGEEALLLEAVLVAVLEGVPSGAVPVAVLEAIPQVLVVVLLVLAEAETILLLGECGEGECGDHQRHERSQGHELPHSA
jgi:hypothetical protein